MRAIIKSILETSLSQVLTHYKEKQLPALLSGLSHIHRVHMIAALKEELRRPVVILCPDATSAEQIKSDLYALLHTEIFTLTDREFSFYAAESVSRQAEQKRLAVLDAMLQNQAEIVVCTAAGIMQRTIPKEVLEQAAFTLESGMEIAMETVETALLDCGYLHADQVEGVGQYAKRGGILDFFSPSYDMPIRCEFWGDTIDAMGFFDIQTQRRIENVASARILPVVEALPFGTHSSPKALAEQMDQIIARVRRQKSNNEKLLEVLTEDAERIRATGSLASMDRYMGLLWEKYATAAEYFPEDALFILSEPSKTAERGRGYHKRLEEDVKNLLFAGILSGHSADYAMDWSETVRTIKKYPMIMMDAFTVGRYPLDPKAIISMTAKQLPSYGGSAETAIHDVRQYEERQYRVVLLAGDERKASFLQSMFQEKGMPVSVVDPLDSLPPEGKTVIGIGGLSAGFEYPEIKLAVLTDHQIVQGGYRKAKRKKKTAGHKKIASHTDLSIGDLVVHEYHGIGKFTGIFKMPVDGVEKDYIKIHYAGKDILYVPATQLDLVSKYVGGGEEKQIRLSKMGGSDWTKTKSRAKAAAKEMAKELIALYAERAHQKGHAFSQDSPWQLEFEESFAYEETEDQLRAITELKEDMEKQMPMDRLLCGDVGFGKTEVAFRGVMKCVLDGKQAAILVPTTVLAQQHYQTAMQRFFGFPVQIEVLSRFRTPAQVKETLRNLKSGTTDIVIGTHRLIQKDVEFKNLGLLVVDEEQRFGVTHKERLKEMSRQVDVLTLTATPIPRTLNLALSGIRDMSVIEEPPQERLPVQTYVLEHDWDVICDAIRREVSRGGQVYYLHNRVENIERTAMRIANMLEDVSVTVAHGKMDEESLYTTMEGMQNGEFQVLVCTTIIETGIDIPNVNTIIIEDADKLGLAQLHQIRGRVGRSNRHASAYLTFRKNKVLSEIAEKRLSAIREFAEFNSGFKIAMRDLEIRGAGNLLGAEQSGHMVTVGYDMYLKLLEEAVLEERGETPEVRAECAADLAVSANIPESYVRSPEQRMDLYRRIALIRTEEEADDLTDELIDRFGEPPSSVNALIHVALLRGEATQVGITDIAQKSGILYFTLLEFDMEAISILYAKKEYKGKLKVEAGQKPRLQLKILSKQRVIEQARKFVADYQTAKKQES